MGRSRGAGKKLCWTSLRQVISKELLNWEGPPFLHIHSFTRYIAPMYWEQAIHNGHYNLYRGYKGGKHTHLILERLLVPAARILKSLGCKKIIYGRAQSREDRFGHRFSKGQAMWLLPNAELPPSAFANFSNIMNLELGRAKQKKEREK